jgi:nucleoside-diphosphate-sugar epimerase
VNARTLLIGGAGFLGAWIARRLQARGDALRVFDVAGETPDRAHVFNLVGEVASNEDVIAAIRRVVPDADLGVDGPDVAIAANVGEGDLRRVFPGLPATSLAEGVARTVAFYREGGA